MLLSNIVKNGVSLRDHQAENIMFKYILFGFIIIGFLSCSSGQGGSGNQGGIVETESTGDFSAADIIRNPITANGPIDSSKVAKIEFENKTYDFGTAQEGALVKHIYKFTNTGAAPLMIGSARSTCGCTIPKWPREPIAPGASGEISVRFNTEGKPNKQSKTITLNANTLPAMTKLYIKGNVIPKSK